MSQQTDKIERVYLGMPGYGSQTAAAARAFWRARRDMRGVWSQYQQGSLLAANFNALWASALNFAHNGNAPEYFAMLHDDIGAQDYWLDILIAEMNARELDVLCAVSPIKDKQGLTSIALGREDGDTWRTKCRLTMNEVFRLPETFTSEDVGHPLLLNTGCWVCRFDPAWVDQVHFTVNDRICFDTNRNLYVAEVESEDWYFSRLCHELGLKLGATRKVSLAHQGAVDFPNTYAWGSSEFDAAYLDKSVIPTEYGFEFPHDVNGWLSETEGRALAKLCHGKRVLEIGSYCGRSTVCIAQSADKITSVDPFDGTGTPNPRDTYTEFKSNLMKYGVSSKVETKHPEDYRELPIYDVVFIDGAHDYESVKADISKALASLKPNGTLAFHDYREEPGQYDGRWDKGVTDAVQELIADGGSIVSRHDTLAIVKPPAGIPVQA